MATLAEAPLAQCAPRLSAMAFRLLAQRSLKEDGLPRLTLSACNGCDNWNHSLEWKASS